MLADLPLGFEIVVAAVFGAMIGSFLNVCILRWGAEPKQSVVHPRSRCPRCGRGLAWYDNIPVLSWLILRARCRGCGEPISVQYPLIELATAAIWAYMVWRYGVTLEALRGALFGTILLGIAMTDAREYIIPHEFSLGGTLLAVLFSAWSDPSLLVPSLQGALVGAGSVLLIGEVSEMAIGQEAMGGGDCALMGMIGAFLGWEAIVPVLFLGAIISTFLFLLAALWSWRTPPVTPVAVEPEATDPGFRWRLVLRLVLVGAVPLLFLALALATGHLNEVLNVLFHALLGAGIAYYVALLLPERIARYSWVAVMGLIGAGIAVAAGAGWSLPRLVLGVIIVIAALWFAKRATLIASPATAEGLQSQGYLPFGVGLTAAAGLLLLSGSMPLVRQIVEEYGRLLSYL
ncbi:MAG TPA: prepilin peptidase [Gemmatimonadales bacterium]|nr:prepilin peptidase [Gemmatimonadales bacterium]